MTVSIHNLIPGIPKTEASKTDTTKAELQATVGFIEPIKWGCEIPYVIEDSVDKDLVKKAIEYVQQTTNYTFVPYTNQHNYIKFVGGDGCTSGLGKGITQVNQIVQRVVTITLSRFCNLDAVIHELGHALGLSHEQQRSDRDAYLDIFYENIENGKKDQFKKDAFVNRGDYDYKSIMHYDRYAFSTNNKPTMKIKQQLDRKVGGNYGFSIDDVKHINSLANAKKCPQKSKPPPCKEDDITFFDGETINTFTSINTHFYKVNDKLYESYDMINGNRCRVIFTDTEKNFLTNEEKPIENPYWTINYGMDIAISTTTDLFNTQWKIFNIDTADYEIVERAKMTKRDCAWPDLSAYHEQLSFHLLNFLSNNVFTLTIIIISVLLLFGLNAWFGGTNYMQTKIIPKIRNLIGRKT
jgi:hypothetical protein